MQAGETDAPGQERIERLSVDSLVLLYTHSAFLADEMICPWACNYSAYSELAIVDQAFCDKLAETIKELLAHCVEASEKYYATTKNRQVTWAKQYYKNVKNAKLDLAQQDTSKWVIVKLSPDVDSKPNDSFAVKKKRAVGNAKARKSTRPLAGTPDMQDPSSGEHNESVTKTRKPKPVNIAAKRATTLATVGQRPLTRLKRRSVRPSHATIATRKVMLLVSAMLQPKFLRRLSGVTPPAAFATSAVLRTTVSTAALM
jgi:hypothetical protein